MYAATGGPNVKWGAPISNGGPGTTGPLAGDGPDTHPQWPSREEPGSGLTASAPVSDVSAPACTNGVWPPLRPVSVAQKNKPSTMSSSSVQSIDLPTDCTAWRFWAMKQPNGCSTPAPKSSPAKQWIKEELAQTKEEVDKCFKSDPSVLNSLKSTFQCNNTDC